jgi:hypothetical protein
MKGSKSVIWLEVFVLVCTGCEILRFFNYDAVISHKYTHTHTLTHTNIYTHHRVHTKRGTASDKGIRTGMQRSHQQLQQRHIHRRTGT